MKPLILLDVDGVLNPEFSPQAWRKREGTGWAEHMISPYPQFPDAVFRVLLNSSHGEMLLKAAEKAGAQLAWASRWNHSANAHIGPRIGLPELPVAWTHPNMEKPDTVIRWTEPHICRELTIGTPMIGTCCELEFRR